MIRPEARYRVERIHILSRAPPGFRKMHISIESPIGAVIERGLVVKGIDFTQFNGKFTSIHLASSIQKILTIEITGPSFPGYNYNEETQILKIVSG